MPGNNHENNFAEDVSASLSRALEDLGSLDEKSRSRSRNGSGKSTHSAPSAENMAEALDSPLNQVLGKADGGFLATLLDGSDTDDPAGRDYGERYHYLDVLGEGGQGRVLRFRDTVLDRDVAIKVVKAPHTQEREKLLENEARLGGMLEHPNILPTYDLQRDETGSPFFVMKKVEGVTLDELLKKAHADGAIHRGRDRGEFSRRRLLNIFIQVCHAMQYAHSRGVCHLDLKPQNVTLGPFGEVYVLDWGFASRVEDNPKMVAGTPLYIAPERFRPGKPDARCDVYSLGVMLYRILVNQLPRDVGKISFKEFRRRIAEFPIIPPRQREPNLPRDLEAIILKALSENPDDRYQTVGELAGDLERFLDILPVTAYQEGVWGKSLKFARRHRVAVVAAASVMAALLLTAVTSLRASQLSAIAEIEVKRAELAEIQKRQAEERTQLAVLRAAEDRDRAQRAEQQREQAEANRMKLLRLRAAARVPMEKGLDIMDRSKTALDREKDKTRRLQLLQPAINLFTDALDILDQDDENNQDAAGAYYARARAYEQAQELEKAEADYLAALDRDKSYIMAHYYLGMIYFNSNQNNDEELDSKALAEFVSMNEIDPGNEFSEVGQAYIDVHRGRYLEALERVNRIEEKDRAARGAATSGDSWRNPGLANVWLIRGLIYGKKREGAYDGKYYSPRRGIEAYTNYLQYDSDKPSPYSNRGVLHEALYLEQRRLPGQTREAEKHLENALADYTRALEVDPNFKTALQHRGYAMFKYKGDIEAALKDIAAALAIDPNYTTVILDRGSIREEQRQFDLAEEDYHLVKKIQPNNTIVDYRFGILYLYTNRLERSEESLTASIDIVRDRHTKGVRYHRRGSVRFLMGRYDEAVQDFDRSLANRNGGYVYPALMRWLALARAGKTPTPAEFAKTVRNDDSRPWLTVVASIFMGDTPEAEEQAFSLAPNPEAVCETAFYLGVRAWIQNDLSRAVTLLERAVDTDYHLATEYNMATILLERVRRQYEDSQRLPDRVGLPPTVPSMSDLVE